MAKQLDYDAGVPLNVRAPFSVQVDPNKPPGDRFCDFKPKHPSQTKPDDTVRRKDFMRPPVARYEADYISPVDAEAKRTNERAQIVELAKSIYNDEKNRRLQYESASKLLETVGDKEDSPEIARARKIVARGAPMSKQQAMEKAAKQFYGLRT